MKKLNLNINYKKLLIAIGVGVLSSFLVYYFFLPPINPHSLGFWFYLTFVIFSFTVSYLGFKPVKVTGKTVINGVAPTSFKLVCTDKSKKKFIFIGVTVLPLLIAAIGGIFSSPLFFAKRYASIISVVKLYADKLQGSAKKGRKP